MKKYPRNMLGYGSNPPEVKWPNNSKIAVQFVLNYEEGGENCVLHGDKSSEIFLSEIIGAKAIKGRHINMESLYEYGSRVGFWRVHKLFGEYKLPLTIFGVGMALERNLEICEEMKKSKYEIASHGWRWIDYQNVSKSIEKKHMQKSINSIRKIFGRANEIFMENGHAAQNNNYTSISSFLRITFSEIETLLPKPKKRFSIYGNDSSRNKLSKLKEIIQYCLVNKINLIMIIPPRHLALTEMERLLTGNNYFNDWKIELSRIVNNSKHNLPEGIKLQLWDFALIND